MRKVLLSIATTFLLLSLDEAISDEPIVVSTVPSDIARRVFIGKDQDMPVSSEWLISISPTLREGKFLVPASAEEALDELMTALPHWYLNSLLKSRGEYECFVEVNDQYVTLVIASWLQANWLLEDSTSSLHQELLAFGASNPPEMAYLIHGGLCEYLKSGKESALERMKNFTVTYD